MTKYILLFVLLWLYLFTFYYNYDNLRFNKSNKVLFYLYMIFYLPVFILIFLGVGLANIIILLSALLECPYTLFSKKNHMILFLKDFNSLVISRLKNYKAMTKVVQILNGYDTENNYFYEKDNLILANYFVQLFRCGISNDIVIESMKAFIISFKSGTTICEWVMNDNTIELLEEASKDCYHI